MLKITPEEEEEEKEKEEVVMEETESSSSEDERSEEQHSKLTDYALKKQRKRAKAHDEHWRVTTRLVCFGTGYFSLGIRCYFLAVPLGFWLVGPWWMLGMSIGMTALAGFQDFLG